jgi:hypothetical protein
MSTFADRIIEFNKQLTYGGKLPKNIRIMNPFRENKEILHISETFYKKFYNDNNTRKIILGINPGRLGSGATGIPFTDTKRMADICGIKIDSINTHEPSSVFIYDVIAKYGGAKKFYADIYINSICPLGFTILNEKGNHINCNYYDYDDLFKAVKPFIIANLKKQIALGVDTKICFVLGKENAKYFDKINKEEKLFDAFEVLEHPRYVEQYKSKTRGVYIGKYIEKLNE